MLRARRYFMNLVALLVTASMGAATSSLYRHYQRPQVESQAPKPRSANGQKPEVVSEYDPDCPPAFEKAYLNYDYAYSVSVPKGMIGYGSCATNHGFGINLLNPMSNWWINHDWPKSYLSVDASYNAEELTSVDEEVVQTMKFLKDKKNVSAVTLIVKSPTRLAHLPALRAVIYYNEGGEAMVEDQVVAFRKQHNDEIGIFYNIDLRTPMSRYEQDSAVVAQIQKSWHVRPLPNP